MTSVYDGVRNRRSVSKVTEDAPDDVELVRLIEAASRVADHAALRPWRIIALRGDARVRLGKAFARAAKKDASDSLGSKPLRAPLLIAIVVSPKSSGKVPLWEQEATAAGVAHTLSLLLDDAGWGVFWRTGPYVRRKAVRKMHSLTSGEELLGWLYVGGVPVSAKRERHTVAAGIDVLTVLD